VPYPLNPFPNGTSLESIENLVWKGGFVREGFAPLSTSYSPITISSLAPLVAGL
jgi:hypothetical protein